MAKKGGLQSTFQNPHGETVRNTSKPGDSVDRNPCEYFSEPRVDGHHGIEEVFTTGVNGKSYHGKVTEISKDVLSTNLNK